MLYDSFIRKSTAEQLNLPEVRTVALVINTFGYNVIKRDFSVLTLKLNSLQDNPSHTVDHIVTDDLVHPFKVKGLKSAITNT